MELHVVNAELIFRLLNNFRHHLLIKAQESKLDYRNSSLFRILGIEQGMRWSPTLCSFVNDVTLSLLENETPGELFTSLLSALEVASCLKSYVDDVNGGINE